MQNIFCVEDDANIRELIEYTLNASGFSVTGFEYASDFFEAIEDTRPSLILLDIMLPDEDGMSILKKLRKNPETSEIPAIMLTAKSEQIDKIKALDCGADDYVTKPFDVPELISRIKAVLRRSAQSSSFEILKHQNIMIDINSRKVSVNNREIVLTYKEFELLHKLISNKGMVMSREKLMDSIWGTDFLGESRTVDVHIRTLRQKLGDEGKCIETVRNVGYKVSKDV